MNIDDLRIEAPAPADDHPTVRKGDRYLGKKMPWSWLAAAARARGRALHVALALWYQASVTRSWSVKLNTDRLRELGLDRHATSRGLRELEKAGLVKVERRAGRKPLVTMVAPPAATPEDK